MIKRVKRVCVCVCVCLAVGADLGQVRLPCIHCGRVMSPSALVQRHTLGFLLLECTPSVTTHMIRYTLPL